MTTKALLLSSLVGALLCAGGLWTARATNTPDTATFLVIYSPGPAWIAGKPVSEQGLGEHFQYMLDLYERGSLKQAGPFTDNTGGAMILEAADAAAAQAVIANDPAVKEQKMTPEIRPWQRVPWEQHLQKRKAQAGSR
jgi:uncharacterized protein YciI